MPDRRQNTERNKVSIEGELQVFITNLIKSNIKFYSKTLSFVMHCGWLMLAYIQ